MNKKTAKYGNVNIAAEDFKDTNVRIQISIKIPMDLLKGYREEAAKQGKGYQTLMQEVLRKALPLSQETQLTTQEIEAIRAGFKKMRSELEQVKELKLELKKLEKVEHRIDAIEEELPKLRRA